MGGCVAASLCGSFLNVIIPVHSNTLLCIFFILLSPIRVRHIHCYLYLTNLQHVTYYIFVYAPHTPFSRQYHVDAEYEYIKGLRQGAYECVVVAAYHISYAPALTFTFTFTLILSTGPCTTAPRPVCTVRTRINPSISSTLINHTTRPHTLPHTPIRFS